MKTETFTCGACDAEFIRPIVRGRRPKWCPPCRDQGYEAGKRCEACGLGQVRRAERFCSRACALPHVGRPPFSRQERATALLARAVKGTRNDKPWFSGPCVMCGTSFTSWHPADKTCGVRCSRRLKESRRTGRSRIRREVIFERDGYRCQLCGKRTDPTRAVPHPFAPTVDHILPRSLGGNDEPSNLQCAHHRCNTLKGNRPWRGAEQLRLTA